MYTDSDYIRAGLTYEQIQNIKYRSRFIRDHKHAAEFWKTVEAQMEAVSRQKGRRVRR